MDDDMRFLTMFVAVVGVLALAVVSSFVLRGYWDSLAKQECIRAHGNWIRQSGSGITVAEYGCVFYVPTNRGES